MTQHLTFANPAFILSLGDRKVTSTTRGSTTVVTHDPLANKTVIVIGEMASFVISYAGLAYIDRLPTDTFIAQSILERASAIAVNSQTGIRIERNERLGLHEVLEKVLGRINSRFPNQYANERAQGLELLISGWTWRPRDRRMGVGRPRMFVAQAVWDPKSRRMALSVIPRPLRALWCSAAPRSASFSCSIGSDAGVRRTFDDVHESLSTIEGSYEPATALRVLSDGMRRAAALPKGSTIGTDLVAVLHSPGLSPLITSVYMPTEDSVLNAYTPWVIGDQLACPPMMFTGLDWHLDGGDLDAPSNPVVAFKSLNRRPREAGELLATLSSQPRAPRPK